MKTQHSDNLKQQPPAASVRSGEQRPCPKCGYKSCLDLSAPSLQNPVIAVRSGEQEKELRRWQDEIREVVVKYSGAPDDKIDGHGCESGDPLDLTLTEIGQGMNYLRDERDSLLQRLDKAEAARWIKTSERWPTQKDADRKGRVLIWSTLAETIKVVLWQEVNTPTIQEVWPYWMPIPPLPQSDQGSETNSGQGLAAEQQPKTSEDTELLDWLERNLITLFLDSEHKIQLHYRPGNCIGMSETIRDAINIARGVRPENATR